MFKCRSVALDTLKKYMLKEKEKLSKSVSERCLVLGIVTSSL